MGIADDPSVAVFLFNVLHNEQCARDRPFLGIFSLDKPNLAETVRVLWI